LYVKEGYEQSKISCQNKLERKKESTGWRGWEVKGINKWTEPGVRMKKLGPAFKECELKGAYNFRSRVNLG
jgi:hypothetical protein